MPSDKRQRQRENSRARQEALIAAQKRSQQRVRIIGGVAIAAVVIALLYFFGPLGGSDTKKNPVSATATTVKKSTTSTTIGVGDPKTCPPATGTKKQFRSFPAAPKMCLDATKTYQALVQTDTGKFTITLDAKQAPNTVNNFVFLARNRYYDGTVFHRVIPDFVDQGGSPDGTGGGGPGYSFADEIPTGYKYAEGDIAMANSGANTNGSQFFLVASPNGADQLLAAVGGVAKYSPFGRITSGLDVVKKINQDGSSAGTPTTIHKIVKVTITEE